MLLPPVRVPRTRNGQKLMGLPRVQTMDLDNPLPQLKGQLDAVLFPVVVAACWKKVLAWPMRTLMTYHDPPTRAIVADPHGALERAVRAAKQL